MKFIFLLLHFLIALSLQGQTIITTFAGTGTVGFSGNGGPATAAQLFDPQTVCSDNAGNIYIPDHGNHVIRKVNAAGIITVFAGTGTLGYSGDGGAATSAQFGTPYGICSDNNGNIYVTDPYFMVVRKIDINGIITTIAGTGVAGYSGDGGPAINAKLSSPCGITIDNSGNIYFAEFFNCVIRKITTAGIISTVVGTGMQGWMGDGGPATSAQLNAPISVAVDNAGNLFVTDMGNNVVRKVNTSGIISRFAGTGTLGYAGDGGPATAASFKWPYFVYVDNSGNVYISDTGNGALRVVNSSGVISTIAGNGTIGYSGDGGPPTSAQLTATGGICFDNAGNTYIADPGAHVIRRIETCLLAGLTLQPAGQAICEGNNTSFNVAASNVTSYQWQVNNGSGWSNLTNNPTYSGATSNTLSVSNATSTLNGNQYRCVVTNNCGFIYSAAANLIVYSALNPSLLVTASFTSICQGTNTMFTATAANTGSSVSYQWKKNGINVGTNSALYNDNGLNNGDIISCILTTNNACAALNTATSNSVSVTVNPLLLPTITINNSQNNICAGSPVSFTCSITNGGTNPSYQWKKNGINVGANTQSYNDNALNNNDVITCVLTSNETCLSATAVNSNPIVMNVAALLTPSVSINTTTPSICPAASVTYTAIPTNGGASPAYQWQKNGIAVGTNSNNYIDNNIMNGDIISCIVTSNAACLTSATAGSNTIAMNVFQNPVVLLDKTNTLCTDGTRVLDAGTFNSYLWNDGSVSRTLLINNTGTYYVTVTDNNGCKGSDTTIISVLLPKPGNFLPPDTSICDYGDLTINAKPGYNSYLWSNNSVTTAITIKQPGSYWLQVKDPNNCLGKDTINVLPKQCLKGFFIPSAFTPNNDGKNDQFRPLIFGNVKSYKFIIYNRWGQVVFQSAEIGKGWDGTFQGKRQDGNVFVWTCAFELEGEKQQYRKGTFVLIR